MYYNTVFAVFVVISTIIQVGYGGPPMVETRPKLLDSFIPASMQVIAHITELMKYEITPPTAPVSTTTSTVAPTRPHKPAIYAPEYPPGPAAYFATNKAYSYEEYVERLLHPTNYANYFDRYKFPEQAESRTVFDEVDDDAALVGKLPTDLLKLVNRIEQVYEPDDPDNQVQEFSQVYDDSQFRLLLLRKKKSPPAKAYVTLLSLYDLLNKESKTLKLNNYSGYSESVLKQLAEISTGTSADQLKSVLMKINQRKDTKNITILKKIDLLIKDLDDDNSYINLALRYIPPLAFNL